MIMCCKQFGIHGCIHGWILSRPYVLSYKFPGFSTERSFTKSKEKPYLDFAGFHELQ